MKHFQATMALALALLAGSATAQTATKPAIDPTHSAKPYRVTYTLTETDGGKPVGVQHYAVVMVEGGRTTLKNGTKVPVATGSYNGGSTAGVNTGVQTQFTYLDVGINLDTTLDAPIDGTWRLKTKVEQSTVAEQKSTIAGVDEPVIRQSVLEASTTVSMGKPQVLGTLDFTGTTRHLEVEVVLEPVK